MMLVMMMVTVMSNIGTQAIVDEGNAVIVKKDNEGGDRNEDDAIML